VSLWQTHEPDLTELGERVERAGRFSFLSDPWVEIERHDPDQCVCYLLPLFFNHVPDNDSQPPCPCSGCREVRRRWRACRSGATR
jgi:hypothetical protein